MSKFTLKSKKEATSLISETFAGGKKARLQISEDSCFTGNWVDIGLITLFPSCDENDKQTLIEQAIDLGFYEWLIRDYTEIVDDIAAMLASGKTREKEIGKIKAAVKTISHVAIRCGFTHPSFDAGSTVDLPFRRPVTIVTDTSAVLQGGLDFVVRFLYPMARIKIPAIAQMEILNTADNFFKLRREAKNKIGSTLLEHAKSQGGQRVLLRLELQTDAEIERPRVGADPLKGFVSPSPDSEDKSLGLTHVQRSYADRLILETALQHRERLPADHQIMLLTSDQGLARMTLSEGLQPLYFSSPDPNIFFNRSYSGTAFSPFLGQLPAQKLYSIPLPELLWELAVTFGGAKLANEDGSKAFIVCAMGEKLAWQPFHSKDDLLWVQIETGDKSALVTEPVNELAPETVSDLKSDIAPIATDDSPPETTDDADSEQADNKSSKPITKSSYSHQKKKYLKGAYQFSIDVMLSLIKTLESHNELSDKNGTMMLNLSSPKRYLEYKHFLVAGSFVDKTESGLRKTSALDDLWSDLINVQHDGIRNNLRRVPSFDRFISELKLGIPITETTVESISKYAFSTYSTLAEICCAAVNIPNEGIYATPSYPSLREFTENALNAFMALKLPTDEYILTGEWLEYLAKNYGIHPIKAKERLNEARQAGLLERYTEGSTPETQFDKHKIYVLGIDKNVPIIKKIHLYQGTFLIPDRTSVMLRLEEKK